MKSTSRIVVFAFLVAIALLISSVSLVAMAYYNQGLALLFFGLMFSSSLIFVFFHKDEHK